MITLLKIAETTKMITLQLRTEGLILYFRFETEKNVKRSAAELFGSFGCRVTERFQQLCLTIRWAIMTFQYCSLFTITHTGTEELRGQSESSHFTNIVGLS